MKIQILSLFFAFWAVHSIAQNTACDAIASGFETGKIELIEPYLPSTLDMTVEETEDVFSRDQAIQILNKFFKTHPPISFSIKHRGKSPQGDNYLVGTLRSKSKEFRVTFFVRNSGGETELKRLRIENTQADF
jgi:hypothetical protein